MVRMSSVWDRATEFLGDNIRAIAPFALVIVLIAATQEWVLAVSAAHGSATQGTQNAGATGIAFALGLVAFFVRLPVMLMAIDGDLTGREALPIARDRLLPVLAVQAILVLALTLIMVLPVVLLAVAGVPLDQLAHLQPGAMQAAAPWATVALGLYVLVLIWPIIWLFARLTVLIPVVLAEARLLGAFGRSFMLTRGRALRILGVLLLIVIVGAVASVAARSVIGTVLRLTLGEGLALPLTALAVALVTTLFTLIGDVFTAKLYVATKAAEADSAQP